MHGINDKIVVIGASSGIGEATAVMLAELSGVRWKRISKHGIAALGLLLCGLVLDDIPMLD
jgi:hypothetical protein